MASGYNEVHTNHDFFERANDALIITNYVTDEIVDVNQRACELFGYTRDELLSMSVPDLQAPEVRGKKGAVLQSELELHRDMLFETLDIHKDGHRIPIEVSTSYLAGAEEPLALCIVRDISVRKQAEQALKKSENRYKSLLEAVPDMMFVLDEHGTYIDYKPDTEALLKVPPERFLGKTVRQMLSPTVAEQIMHYIAITLSTKQVQIFNHDMMLDNTTYHFETRMAFLDENHVVSIVRNVTDRKKVEMELHEMEKQYRLITRNMSDVICLLDKNLQLLYLSPSSEELFGYTAEDFMGKDLLFMVHPEDKIGLKDDMDKELLEKGEREWRNSFRVLRKDGAVRWIDVIANIIYTPSGEFDGVVTTHRDITA